MLVREIMTSPVTSVGEHTPCAEALALLARQRLTALPVVDSGGAVVGLLSEVDLLRSALEADPRTHLGHTQTHGEPLPPVVADLMTRGARHRHRVRRRLGGGPPLRPHVLQELSGRARRAPRRGRQPQ